MMAAGRVEIGPQLKVRLSQDVLEVLDLAVLRYDVGARNRSELIRAIVTEWVAAYGQEQGDRIQWERTVLSAAPEIVAYAQAVAAIAKEDHPDDQRKQVRAWAALLADSPAELPLPNGFTLATIVGFAGWDDVGVSLTGHVNFASGPECLEAIFGVKSGTCRLLAWHQNA